MKVNKIILTPYNRRWGGRKEEGGSTIIDDVKNKTQRQGVTMTTKSYGLNLQVKKKKEKKAI